MAKKATYIVGALNVTIHPHTAELYVKLFKDAFAIRRSVKIHGDTHAVVHTVFNLVEGKSEQGLNGNLIKYTEINPNDPWYDVAKGKVATKEQLADLSIPEGLAPNMKWTRYFFEPKHHKLVWVSYSPDSSFSPPSVWKIFSSFFQRSEITAKYGQVEVTIEQDRTKLEKILNMYRIDSLTIEYTLPNPDDDDDDAAEKSVEKTLEEQKIGKVLTNYKAKHNQGIAPNKKTKALARLALSNGHVEARGRDTDGKKQIENTEKHPWSKIFKEEKNKTNLAEWLPRIVDEIISQLSKK